MPLNAKIEAERQTLADTCLASPLTLERAHERLLENLHVAPVSILEGKAAMGKTMLLARLIDEFGGVRIDGRTIVAATSQGAHLGIEEALLRLLEDALAANDLVVLDDMQYLGQLYDHARHYPRAGNFTTLLHLVMTQARVSGKRLVLAWTNPNRSDYLEAWLSGRALITSIGAFEATDYAALLHSFLGADDANRVDVDDLYHYAPGLNILQLRMLASYLGTAKRFDSQFVRETMESRILRTNTRLEGVADIAFDDLKGFEHIAEALTTYVLNPLRNDGRLKGLDLQLKRGVLLCGPPGTGKTSVGKALARQMEGKFFLIDGTFSPEPAGQFFLRLRRVIEQAKAAAPCILFIDDADVLMQSGYAEGIGRYLLTMLDGLESQSTGKIAVILTAVNPSSLPPALLRSGRVELWLETKVPPDAARADMIADHVADLPDIFRQYDTARLMDLTHGFNAADMRGAVSDVKALYAKDVIAGTTLQATDAYFEQAIQNIRRNKILLQLAEAGGLAFVP